MSFGYYQIRAMSMYVRPPLQLPYRAREHYIATVVNGASATTSKLKWGELVSHVLEGMTPEDVHCALGLDAAQGAVLLDHCRRSFSFEQMVVKDIPLLSSLANWVREMNIVRVGTLEAALISLETAMRELRNGITNTQLTSYGAKARHDRLSELIVAARKMRSPPEPADACTPYYEPTDGSELVDMNVVASKKTLVAEMSQAYNTKRAVSVMRAAIAHFIDEHLRPYLDALDRLNEEGVDTKAMFERLDGVERLLNPFADVEGVIRVENGTV